MLNWVALVTAFASFRSVALSVNTSEFAQQSRVMGGRFVSPTASTPGIVTIASSMRFCIAAI